MKFCLLLLCLYLITHYVYSAITEKQLNATKKLVQNTCINKSKATIEQVEAMQKGDFSGDKIAQCYLHCIMTTYKLLTKDNEFAWEDGVKSVANAPPNIGEPAAISVKNCKDAVKTPSDKCTASMEIAKCIYDDNPSNYFFP